MKKIITLFLLVASLTFTSQSYAQAEVKDSVDNIPNTYLIIIEGLKHGIEITRSKRGEHGKWEPVNYNVVQYKNVQDHEKIWVEDTFGKKYRYLIKTHELKEII